MIDVEADVAVIGSSFAGSLMALIAERIGLRPVLVDRNTHPRFALGESTTPIANIVLRDLALRYDLPSLVPLTKYGPWKRERPQLVCGRKRGFSFFKLAPETPFQPQPHHANELLVTASLDDERSDTHWLRADVDSYFAGEVERSQIPSLDRVEISELESDRTTGGWKLAGRRGDEAVRVRAQFIVDSTGEGGFLGRMLDIRPAPVSFSTNSRAIYAHFAALTEWQEMMTSAGCSIADHPFDCDDAAVHHILDGAWMWQLRFDNKVTSAGLTIDNGRYPLDESLTPVEEWNRWMSRYPTLARQFQHAEIVAPVPGRLVRTPRLQRQWSSFVGPGWAMLPQTGGVIDALFSTGIAQSLCGIERLAGILERDWNCERLTASLGEYERAVRSEITFVDELVGNCFRTFDRFERFADCSMLYFAAATTCERRRVEEGHTGGQFLCADDAMLREAVSRISHLIDAGLHEVDLRGDTFAAEVARVITPFNTAGLCDPTVGNMYRYTAPPDSDFPK